EQLSISKPVAIIGAAKSEDGLVVIQCNSSTVVSFSAGSGNPLGHVTLKLVPHFMYMEEEPDPLCQKCFISDSENVGIFITDDAQGYYEGND
ncbi:unnamed protein product, partial [Pocillopora meandrina]